MEESLGRLLVGVKAPGGERVGGLFARAAAVYVSRVRLEGLSGEPVLDGVDGGMGGTGRARIPREMFACLFGSLSDEGDPPVSACAGGATFLKSNPCGAPLAVPERVSDPTGEMDLLPCGKAACLPGGGSDADACAGTKTLNTWDEYACDWSRS